MKLTRDLKDSKTDLGIAFLVGLLAVGLPYGYIIGLIVGTLLAVLIEKRVVKLGE